MKKFFKAIIVTLMVMGAPNYANACEKWWWEFGETALISASYLSAYSELGQGKITDETFTSKANLLINDLFKVKEKIEHLQSCPSEENTSYEERRQKLKAWIVPALTTMKLHGVLRSFTK